jgi:hypothetical protein
MTQIEAGPNGAGSRSYRPRRSKGGQFRPTTAGLSSPEGRFVADSGKALSRHLAELRDREANAQVKLTEAEAALARAETLAERRRTRHRGGDLTWLLRLIIPVAIIAEGVTAYIGMEVLVSSRPLADGLAALAAFVGAGIAGILANRRLNRLPVPAAARTLEGVFVVVLTLLRYDSLRVQGADLVAAAGGAALAALISALGLLGIEEILVETQTFGIFLGRIRVTWKQWRCARAVTRLRLIQAQVHAAAEKLEQHFVAFLLKEGTPLGEARQHAAALRCGLMSSGAVA